MYQPHDHDQSIQDQVAAFLGQMAGAHQQDLDRAFGYDYRSPFPRALRRAYDRGDVVRALTDARPDASWAGRNQLTLDGEPSEELHQFAREHDLWTVFFRADLMAEITGYAVVVMPGRNLAAAPTAAEAMLPLAVYGADDITWDMEETDILGYPAAYSLFGDDENMVNPARCVHVADARYSKHPLVGNSRLISAWNQIVNWKKFTGGGAEAAHQSLIPQWHADLTGSGSTPGESRFQKIKDGIKQFSMGRFRTLTTSNATIERFAPDVPDISANAEFMLTVLSAAFRVPLSEVTGEALVAHSAATNLTTWMGRINERRFRFCEPVIVARVMAWLRSVLDGNGGVYPPSEEARFGVLWESLMEDTQSEDTGEGMDAEDDEEAAEDDEDAAEDDDDEAMEDDEDDDA